MKRDYMTRLSRNAYRRLPPAEAREVVEDYSDIVSQTPRSERELYHELGKPADAIRLLTPKKTYRVWLAVFAALVVCIMLPAVGPLPITNRWDLTDWIGNILIISRPFSTFARLFLLVAGIVVSQIWFRSNGVCEKGKFTKRMLPLLIIQFLWLIWTWVVAWATLNCRTDFLAERVIQGITRVVIIGEGLNYGGFVMALIGVFGLVRARTDDRRWLAVYALGMTASAMCVAIFAVLTSMSLDPSEIGWQIPIIRYYVAISVIGLVGTGVSLC